MNRLRQLSPIRLNSSGGMVTAGSSVRSAAQRANLRRHSMSDGAVAVDEVLRLLVLGRLMERDRDAAVLQGLGEDREPRESRCP